MSVKPFQALAPGKTIGILGGGQLGRMLAECAKKEHYKVAVLDSDPDTPAMQVADFPIVASFNDEAKLKEFATRSNVATFEFENIPVHALEVVDEIIEVFPKPGTLAVYQDRLKEKAFLKSLALPLTPFEHVSTSSDLTIALSKLGYPAVLKRSRSGYDGKGQWMIRTPEDLKELGSIFDGSSFVLEKFAPFTKEVSMIGARSMDGSFAHYGLIENAHVNHILDVSFAPADVDPMLVEQASQMVRKVFDAQNVVGVMCVEFFVMPDNTLLINEVAPRTHNSGHLTIEACETSQFAQQLRAITGQGLGPTTFKSPAAMANLLGDLWEAGQPRNNLSDSRSVLHLYGKKSARKGRKMGHITSLGNTVKEAVDFALNGRSKLFSDN